MLPETHAYDPKLAIEMRHLDNTDKECRILTAQVLIQDEKIKQLQDELNAVDWHIQFIKDGHDYD